MTLSLPRPYQDELLYSVLARHFAYQKPTGIVSAYKAIDGRRRFSTSYARGAARLADETATTWGMSGLQIIELHTLLPFSGAFLGPAAYLRCTAHFLGETPRAGAVMLGAGNSSVREPHFFRFCTSCMRADLRVYGETYWRRQHQLPGTLLCMQHDEILKNTHAARASVQNHISDATEHCLESSQDVTVLNADEARLARLIAERSASILHGRLSPWLHPDTRGRYERAAAEAGYGLGFRKLDMTRLIGDLIGYFSTSLLLKLGCNLSERSPALRNTFHELGTNHPLIHVLVQIFLDQRLFKCRSVLRTQAIDGTSRQEWKCPNVHAGHSADFRIPTIACRKTGKGDGYFYAQCSCGFAFSFYKSQDDDPDMPFISRVSKYGRAIEIKARKLYARRRSVQAVCRELHLSHRAISRFVNGSKNAFEASPEKIATLRTQWLETRSRNSYQALLRKDREWILGRSNRHYRRRPRDPFKERTIKRV